MECNELFKFRNPIKFGVQDQKLQKLEIGSKDFCCVLFLVVIYLPKFFRIYHIFNIHLVNSLLIKNRVITEKCIAITNRALTELRQVILRVIKNIEWPQFMHPV